MRTLEEVEETAHSDTEITLGTSSILGIFFALALVCGVFFGFGYSLGRGNTSKAVAPTPVTAPAPEAETESPLPVKTVVEQPSPQVVEASTRKPSGAITGSEPIDTAAAAPQLPAATPVSQTITPAAKSIAPAVVSAPNASETAAAIPAAAIMVQIAAVARPQDAEVLVSALGKLGYHASVHPAAADSLLHVQIGPFATRDEAKAMRTKLLNDGYNAILK
jgi:cell division septation protein DedD